MATSVWSQRVGNQQRICVATLCLLTGEVNVVAAVGEQTSGFNQVSRNDHDHGHDHENG